MFKDMIGLRFGRLTVIAFVGLKGTKTVWQCKCDCGSEKAVQGTSLRRGLTRSCGCYARERRSESHATHRMKGSQTHNSWGAMLYRCRNQNFKDYANYGGRGIRVCNGFVSFDAFFAAMGPRPKGTSLDRKNNEGHYSCGQCPECRANGWPANCRWATASEQQRNKRDSRLLTFRGETKTAAEWAETCNVPAKRIISHLSRGWTTEQAISLPPQRPGPHTSARPTVCHP